MVAPGAREWFEGPLDSQNVNLQLSYRIFGGGVAITLGTAALLFTLRILTFNQAAYLGGFALVGGAFLMWVFRRQYRISALLIDDEQLVIETANARESYRWEHIESFELKHDPRQAKLSRAMKMPNPPIIRLRLRRRPRSSLFTFLRDDKSTSRSIGVPAMFKALDLSARDIDGLAAAVQQHCTKLNARRGTAS